METMLTVHSKWPRETCRERTSTVKLAGGFTQNFPEGHEQKRKLARLCRSVYGTRDAASIWKNTWSEVVKDDSMEDRNRMHRFLFCSHDGDLKGLCHGNLWESVQETD